jgi:hypothetical protein
MRSTMPPDILDRDSIRARLPGPNPVTSRSPHAPPSVPSRAGEVWWLAIAVGVAGGLVSAAFGGIASSTPSTAAVTLEPYLDPAWRSPATEFLAPALGAPALAAILVALGAIALVLACDAVIRNALLASRPQAAALAAVVLLPAAAWGPALRLEGQWGVVAGFLAAPAAWLAIASPRRGGAWAGVALALAALLFHPAWAGAVVAVGAAIASRRLAAPMAGLVAGAVGLLAVALAFGKTSGPPVGVADRLVWAARDLAAAPVLVFAPWRRLDLPTGYEALVTSSPVVVGALVHALVLGAGMMIGGVRRGLLAAAAACASAAAAALLVPGAVPWNRAVALPVMAAYAPLLALVLAAAPERLARATFPGLVLGAGAVAFLLARDRAPQWTRIGSAMALTGGRDFAREPDPARLVLYLHAVTLRDPDAKTVADAASRLLDAGAPALHRDRLGRILARTLAPAAPPGADLRRTPALEQLVREATADLALVERLWIQGPRANFDAVAAALIDAQYEVLDLWFNHRHAPETVQVASRYQRITRDVAPVASRTGQFEISIPLLQTLQLIGPELPDTAATIAIQQVLAGQVDDGRAALAAAIATLPPRTPFTAFCRGVLGMTLFRLGDPVAGLAEMQAAWSTIGAGGAKNVGHHFTVDSVDYAVVGEILLARFEAATAVDPALAPQAARDVEDLLKPLLSFGPRRVPPLALVGRLSFLRGDRDRALRLLREARVVPHATLDDLADGPIGRISHPRWRRLALETLLLALGDDAAAAAERDEVREELARIPER